MKARLSLSWVLALLLAVPSVAFAQDRRDVRLADDIARAVLGSARLTIFDDIGARVENGVVTLTGKVKSNVERMLARSLATGLGELSVTNELRTDAEVRSEEARSQINSSELPGV